MGNENRGVVQRIFGTYDHNKKSTGHDRELMRLAGLL